jgi:hypothetical protein
MEASCERAIELGLPSIAFTEHADFVPWVVEPESLPQLPNSFLAHVTTEAATRTIRPVLPWSSPTPRRWLSPRASDRVVRLTTSGREAQCCKRHRQAAQAAMAVPSMR